MDTRDMPEEINTNAANKWSSASITGLDGAEDVIATRGLRVKGGKALVWSVTS
jgi:hypothetical protein